MAARSSAFGRTSTGNPTSRKRIAFNRPPEDNRLPTPEGDVKAHRRGTTRASVRGDRHDILLDVQQPVSPPEDPDDPVGPRPAPVGGDGLGWGLIGFQDQHVFSPPFGHYDRDYPGFEMPAPPRA